MPLWELSVVFLLIVVNGFFAMSELAVVSARRARLEQMARQGRAGARKALALAEDPTGFLSTVQVGITLIGIFAGAYSGATLAGPLAGALRELTPLAAWSEPVALTLVVVGTTYLSLIIGELVPKRMALQNAEAIASFVAGPMTLLARIGRPLVWFLRLSTETVLRLLGVKPNSDNTVTEEEVRAMIVEGAQTGVFHEGERRLLEGVLRFADRPVRGVMAPRREVVCLSLAQPFETVLDAIRESGHSRFPVCDKDMDDVQGVVHVKDVLDMLRRGGGDLRDAMSAPLFVSDAMPSLQLLEHFRRSRVHMAVVVDEYGALKGIVTPADILTSIAGDLPESIGEASPDAVKRADGSWLLEGSMAADEAGALLEIDGFGDADYTTLAGFVLASLEHIPAAGESFDFKGWRFEVVDMDGRRIDKILAARLGADGG